MLQGILILVIFIALIIPTGKYLYHIAAGKRTFADPVFNKFDNLIYKVCGITKQDMSWKRYILAMLLTNLIIAIIGYLILSFQGFIFLNPNGVKDMDPMLAFNTISSFLTNTNLQHYSGESSISYFSQMTVIIFMMFTSAATGFSVAMAFIRGVVGKFKTMGNFYVDMIRITTRVLLPLSLIIGIVLVSQGVPQNLSPNLVINTIEGKFQDIAMGPMASLESIKHLGTNGGGFLAGNSSTPFENPNIVTNIIEILSMMLLPGSCVIAFGHMAYNNRRKSPKNAKIWLGKQAKPIFAVMFILLIIGMALILNFESSGNPALENVGLSQDMGNMEGKEVRFGVPQSSIFTSVTTAFSTGSVNNMHESLTPLGGMIPLLNMMLNMVFGGTGVGLMNMFLYVILAVFISGLMIGQTPEYLGKKIQGREMKLTALAIIINPLLILGFSALAVFLSSGTTAADATNYHGLTQVLYEFTSSVANNGSGFEGLEDSSNFWNLTTGIVMLMGRYLTIILQLAIAGSLLKKPPSAKNFGTLDTSSVNFTVVLFVVILVIAPLTFFPSIVMGPIAEHLWLWG